MYVCVCRLELVFQCDQDFVYLHKYKRFWLVRLWCSIKNNVYGAIICVNMHNTDEQALTKTMQFYPIFLLNNSKQQ